jgi:molecular chaperone GrpE
MSSKKSKMHPIGSEAEQMPEGNAIPLDGSVPEVTREPSPALDELQKQLAEAQSQAAEYKDGWQRALADFQNYKRRVDIEKEETYRNAIGSIVKRYLTIMDDLERALQNKSADPWADGIELIYRKLKTILENEGLKRIEAEGQMFDPNFHEAITSEPSEEYESGQIIAVVQNGYMLGERVIRPAMVRVAQ